MVGVVLASDGIWEKLSNDVVTSIVEKSYAKGMDAKKAASEVVLAA